MLKIIEIRGENEDGEDCYSLEAFREDKEILGFSARDLAGDYPEDATLGRDMNFAYDAIKFFKLGYEAGKNNEEVIYEVKEWQSEE